jgi:hypothetical protein
VLNARRTGGQLLEVGHMDGQGQLALDERAILWPGGQRRRPSELTLPKHLRVTLVLDPPFVYALPGKFLIFEVFFPICVQFLLAKDC